MSAPRGLEGRVVVVVGAASGIGAATASQLAKAGTILVLADRDEERLEQHCEHVQSVQPRTIAVGSDVSDQRDLTQLAEGSLRKFGRVDGVVNCAGILHAGAFQKSSTRLNRRQIEVNLLGTINVTATFLPLFEKQNSGHVVHVASLGGIAPLPYSAVYAATKFAIRGFCLSLALELRDTGIDVSVVCPDSTDTPQLRHEALNHGSPLSFMDPPLRASAVAKAIVATLRRPRTEVLVPRHAGWLALIGGACPRLLQLTYPVLNSLGTRRRNDYVSRTSHDTWVSAHHQSVADAQ